MSCRQGRLTESDRAKLYGSIELTHHMFPDTHDIGEKLGNDLVAGKGEKNILKLQFLFQNSFGGGIKGLDGSVFQKPLRV